MRNLKRVLSLALALVMVLGMMVISTSAATFAEEEIENVEAVEVMNALGIIKGDGGKFYPDRVLTREEAAKILAYATLGPKVEDYLTGSEAPFTDVKADRWSAKYVTYCKNLGIIAGMGDGTFAPKEELTVVGFGKLLLGAIGYDTTKYVGSNWVNAVKDDMVLAGLDIVTFDEKTLIDRDTACQMALIAMMQPLQTATDLYVVKVTETDKPVKEFTDMVEAYDYADKLNTLKSDADYCYVDDNAASGTLLGKVYEVDYDPDFDAFGRPGDTYSWGTGANKVEMFYADAPIATFEGKVTQEELFAAAGVTSKTTPKIDYTLIEENVVNENWDDENSVLVNGGKHVAYKAEETTAKWVAAGTGEGIKSELYKEMVGTTAVYTLVSVREFLGTVTVNEIDPEVEGDKRTITVALTRAGQPVTTVEYETEEFAKDDKVIVTIADGDEGYAVQTIALAEAVEGKVTKITDKGVYTIADKEYVLSQNWVGSEIALSGTEPSSWYVDSMGNLIGDKSPAQEPATVWYYGVVLDADGQGYVPADAADLLGDATEGKEAKEVVKMLKADGEVEIIETNWEYTTDRTTGAVTKVTFVNDVEQEDCSSENEFAYGADITSGLVKYSLVDGKIDEIKAIDGEGDDATGKATATADVAVKKGAATLDSKYVNDNTVYFVTDGTDSVIYTGYKSIPATGLATTKHEYFYAVKANGDVDDTSIAAVYVTVADVDVDVAPEYGLVWYASTDKYTSKDGNATVTTYTNVYLDGVKGEISFKGEHFAPVAGTLYYYAVDEDGYASTPYSAANGNEGKLDTTKTISRVEADYYVSAHGTYPVVYVDADTVYYQVDATTKAVTEVEGLPAIDATGATTIEQICFFWADDNTTMDVDHPVAIVYFAVKDAE